MTHERRISVETMDYTRFFFDEGEEQTVNINGKSDMTQIEKQQENNVNETITKHKIETIGKQTLRFRLLQPGLCYKKSELMQEV